jgi:hypothetical protein
MASITLSLPDDLASQIGAQRQQLPRIPEPGLRELNAGDQFVFDGAADARIVSRVARSGGDTLGSVCNDSIGGVLRIGCLD